jgi:hypothetical protein
MRQLLVVCAIILVAQLGAAQVPGTMSYQGVLLDGGGVPVPDGPYSLTFRIYTSPIGGVALWTETQIIAVEDGVFDAILGSVVPLMLPFDTTYWLGTQVGAAPELAPRTELAAAPYAHRARFADIGSPDDDWVISGDDIYHVPGSVGIGAVPPLREAAVKEGAPDFQGRGAYKLYTSATDQVAGYFHESETVDDPADFLGGVVGYRNSSNVNPGSGLNPNLSNFGVMGYNLWGDEYTYGVAGVTWFDNPLTAGVFAYEEYTDLWSALAYRDGAGNDWGVYTPGRGHFGDGLMLPSGAANGFVLTSDAFGNGTWQPGGGGGIGGSGTTNYMTKFTGATTVGNSIAYDTGSRIGIGTTSPGSRFVVMEATDGQALEVISTAVGSAPRMVNFERTNDPGGANDMLQIMTPVTAPDNFQFIECERGAGNFEFVVDGDGRVTAQGGAVINGDVSVSGTLDVTTTNVNAGVFRTGALTSTARPVYAEYTGTGSLDAVAVEGESVPTDYFGIGGRFTGGWHGVQGRVYPTGGAGYVGVYGYVSGGSGTNNGVYGYASGSGINYAGYFSGNLRCTGTLSKGAGSFQIDHPLDPENKYLRHSFVESPDMMNIYNGNVILDGSGSAWIEMPEWFDALNMDFRYQLTAIGAPGPNLYVATEMSGNRFQIAGGDAGMKVSWQVTGIREDAYARANRIPVEEDKPAGETGTYLHPEAFGLPTTLSVDYEMNSKMSSSEASVPQVQKPNLEERDRAEE